jgi:hypothetical protein
VPTALDADDRPDDVAAWAASVHPGGDVLAPLSAVDVGRLSVEGRIDALAALDRQRSFVEAHQVRVIVAMAEAADRSPFPLDKDWVREDVATALRLSRDSAMATLMFARSMTRLPATLGALEGGRITVQHARVLADGVVALAPEVAAQVEIEALVRAGEQTVTEFRRTVAKSVATRVTATAQQRHLEARAERRVSFRALPDGMESVWALLPADRAAALRARIEAGAARVVPGDCRTADQRRADALAGLADLPAEADGGASPVRRTVQVTVALSTLLGLDDQPGQLAGSGPIPAVLARHMAADRSCTWRRLVTDGTGRLLDYGRMRYRPPADLAEFVMARDATCCFPGCAQPAAQSDLDHRIPWSAGGTTAPGNIHALCKRHHHLKHETGWSYQPADDGDLLWTGPGGQTYLRRAARYPVDRTADGSADESAVDLVDRGLGPQARPEHRSCDSHCQPPDDPDPPPDNPDPPPDGPDPPPPF